MKVFNLTTSLVAYKNKSIPPNGGYVELDISADTIPNRDRELAKKGILSFGSLPANWKPVSEPITEATPETNKIASIATLSLEEKITIDSQPEIKFVSSKKKKPQTVPLGE